MRSDLVPDSGIWIQVMRHTATWRTLEAGLRAGRIWLSSVADAELYAVTRSREDGLNAGASPIVSAGRGPPGGHPAPGARAGSLRLLRD